MNAAARTTSGSVVDAVMRSVATQPHPVAALDLPGAPGCRATVTAVASAVRLALDTEPGLLVRRCRLEPGADPARVVVWVSLVMRLRAWPGVAAVRERVGVTVRQSFGLGVERVDVDVVDVDTDLGAEGESAWT